MIHIYSDNSKCQCEIDSKILFEELYTAAANVRTVHSVLDITTKLQNVCNALNAERETTRRWISTGFYDELFINGASIRFHFDVILALRMSQTSTIQSIPLNVFGSIIKFTPTKSTLSQTNNADDPIILVRFPFNGASYLVIDGNHRITTSLSLNKKVKKL